MVNIHGNQAFSVPWIEVIQMIIPQNDEKTNVCINHRAELLNMGDFAFCPWGTFGNRKMVLVVPPRELLLASGE